MPMRDRVVGVQRGPKLSMPSRCNKASYLHLAAAAESAEVAARAELKPATSSAASSEKDRSQASQGRTNRSKIHSGASAPASPLTLKGAIVFITQTHSRADRADCATNAPAVSGCAAAHCLPPRPLAGNRSPRWANACVHATKTASKSRREAADEWESRSNAQRKAAKSLGSNSWRRETASPRRSAKATGMVSGRTKAAASMTGTNSKGWSLELHPSPRSSRKAAWSNTACKTLVPVIARNKATISDDFS
mmetsp:Transcript_116719/g.371360  ORF Transcript_116719/g.371360 Transcript_116719/m.371360 type:complete len:250 (+) Transcript_116719:1305-2054(+)